ncbi:putative inactive receptor kinase-like [Capsicum annuum]|nr:putative inactive receptor kinase-like [Capsicum annuum]
MGHDTNTGDDDEHMGDDSNNSGDDDDFTNVEEDYGGCTYGLAYDPISDDYKVFMISMFRPDDNEIFTLKNNASWRIIDHKISGRTDSSMLTGGEYLPFVHGAFHWIGMLSRFCVVSFNISDEMYGEISLPAIVCCLTLSKSEVEVEVDVGVSLLGEMLSVYYDVVLLCFDHHYEVKPDYLYRVIFSGAFGLSDLMWPLDGTVTIDKDGCVYTESLMSLRLGH